MKETSSMNDPNAVARAASRQLAHDNPPANADRAGPQQTHWFEAWAEWANSAAKRLEQNEEVFAAIDSIFEDFEQRVAALEGKFRSSKSGGPLNINVTVMVPWCAASCFKSPEARADFFRHAVLARNFAPARSSHHFQAARREIVLRETL
jgi:hypothetical protein